MRPSEKSTFRKLQQQRSIARVKHHMGRVIGVDKSANVCSVNLIEYGSARVEASLTFFGNDDSNIVYPKEGSNCVVVEFNDGIYFIMRSDNISGFVNKSNGIDFNEGIMNMVRGLIDEVKKKIKDHVDEVRAYVETAYIPPMTVTVGVGMAAALNPVRIPISFDSTIAPYTNGEDLIVEIDRLDTELETDLNKFIGTIDEEGDEIESTYEAGDVEALNPNTDDIA